MHWRETCGAGSRGPARPVESWHGPPTREEPSRHAASTEAGAQTPAGSGRGCEGPQGAAALARAVAVSRTPGARSLLDPCASRGFGQGSVSGRSPGSSHESEAGAGSARKGAKPTAQVLIGSDLIRRSHSPDLTQPGPTDRVPKRGEDLPATAATSPSFSPAQCSLGSGSLIPGTSSLPGYIAPC